MRVSQVSVYVVPAAWREYLFVEVRTEGGLCGTGEATIAGQTSPVVATVQQLAEDLRGRDAREVNAHVHRWLGTYWRGGPILTTAVAGLEIALWDLCGQELRAPVCQLLGGTCRAGIPVYANGWFERGPGHDDVLAPQDLAPLAARTRERGFRALKFYPLGYASPARRVTTDDFARGLERVASVREAVGPDMDVMLDVHGMLTATEALSFAHNCEPFRPFWLEEPVPPEDLDGAVLVAGASRVPIAMGERLYTPSAFLPLLTRRGCAVAQPDPLHVGGLSMFTRIAALAGACGIHVAPHNSNGPIALAACVHLAAALPEIITVEYPLDLNTPWRNDLVDVPYTAVAGTIPLPSRPGLGLHLNQDIVQRHLVATIRE